MQKLGCLAAALVLLGGCPELRNRLMAAIADCGPELVSAVVGDLDAPDWTARLGNRAAAAGASAVACALRHVLDSIAGTGGSSMIRLPAAAALLVRRARAEAWLAAHPALR